MDSAFLSDILEYPDDDAPRLIYADWLEEHGQPERAEFIRVQCELARMEDNDPRRATMEAREAELLKAHERSWVPPDKLALFFKWKRGFVAVLEPCRRGVFAGEDSLKVLAEFPLAEELLFSFSMRDAEFQYMPDLPNLRKFGIGGNTWLTVASMPRIGRWRTLRHLLLEGRDVTDDFLSYLSGLSELRELNLSFSHVTGEGLHHLRHLTSLETLDLSDTPATGQGLDALQVLPRLRRLNLSNTVWWEQGIGGLIGSQSLEELRLGSEFQNFAIGDEDLAPLLHLPTLRVLDLGGWCELSAVFLEALRTRLPLEELSFNGVNHAQGNR
jgi:uncharacterized protein (TIGR02996 family)